MLRALHFTSDLGFNFVRDVMGLKAESASEILQKMGGLYAKTSQLIHMKNPEDTVFNECTPVNIEETEERLKKYCESHNIPFEEVKFIASGSIGLFIVIQQKIEIWS